MASAVARTCASRREVLAAYVFGSVAARRTHPDSDVDITVLSRGRLSQRRALWYRTRLAGELGAALRHGGVQVVVLNEAPPVLAHRVLSRGVLVFERSQSRAYVFRCARPPATWTWFRSWSSTSGT